MSVKRSVDKINTEASSNSSFRFMAFSMKVHDFLRPYIEKRIGQFDIEKGMTVVDYGCGPGRYTTKLAELVGEKGKVYALDIHRLAVKTVRKKIEKHNLKNIEPILIDGYNSTLPDDTADAVCAIDMFPGVKNPAELLKEIRRIIKNEGTLIIDYGYGTGDRLPPGAVKPKILDSKLWEIIEETSDHLKCKPL